MAYVLTSWAYREVISSTKLQQMSDNDTYLKAHVDALEALPAWVTLALSSSWTSYDGGATFGNPASMLKLGRTELTGAIKGGTPAALVFTLPVGQRPLKTLDFIVPANAGTAQLRINPNGTALIMAYFGGATNAIVSLNQVSFVAEQ